MSQPDRLVRFVWAACLLAGLCPSAAVAQGAEEVRVLVEGSQSETAYAACAKLDPQNDPAVDLWCGVAAVDTGRAPIGVLAIERFVLHFPDDVRARLELARAYFYAGDDRRSRQEFEAVLRSTTPPVVQAGIRRYLDALRARESEYTTRLTGYVEFGGGYDSNVNGGVAQADIGLPVLGRVLVADAGVAKGDGFGWLAAGAQLTHPVAPGSALFGIVVGNGSFYASRHAFDLDNLALAIGARHQAGVDAFAVTYGHGEILLDRDEYRASDGVGFEWRRQLANLTTISVTPQYARLRYAGDNAPRNADYAAIAFGVRRAWLTSWQPVASGAIYVADERNREDRPWLGRKFYGIGGDLTLSPSPLWALTAALGYQRSDYDGAYPILERARKDDTLTAAVGATYLFARNWSARLEYQYTRNDSNLELFTYDRNVVALKLRYDLY